MPRIGPVFVGAEVGEPVAIGSVRLVPVIWLVRVVDRRRLVGNRLDRARGFGLVWARPVGVRVVDARGERMVRVPGPARRVWLGLLSGFLVAPLVSGLIGRLLTWRRLRSTERRRDGWQAESRCRQR